MIVSVKDTQHHKMCFLSNCKFFLWAIQYLISKPNTTNLYYWIYWMMTTRYNIHIIDNTIKKYKIMSFGYAYLRLVMHITALNIIYNNMTYPYFLNMCNRLDGIISCWNSLFSLFSVMCNYTHVTCIYTILSKGSHD